MVKLKKWTFYYRIGAGGKPLEATGHLFLINKKNLKKRQETLFFGRIIKSPFPQF